MEKITSIFLCGGTGTRMRSTTKHKVVFEINKVPAILRSMRNYQEAGIEKSVVVLGALANQVISCVSTEFSNVLYGYQKEQKGTGNAAKVGFEAIDSNDINGPIIITMGDKITSTLFIKAMLNKYFIDKPDLLFAVQPKVINPTGGRVVCENNSPIGIREELDTKKALVYKKLITNKKLGLSEKTLERNINEYIYNIIRSDKKRNRIVSEVKTDLKKSIDSLNAKSMITINEKRYEAEYIEASEYTNASIYIISRKAAEYALPKITANNVQDEEYLTDIVEILSAADRFNLQTIPVENKYQIMSFNNVDELLEIEDFYKSHEEKSIDELNFRKLKLVSRWINIFEKMEKTTTDRMIEVYGDDTELLIERRIAYLTVLKQFKESYGDKKVIISRSPGRVNIMGRHIDHRGGNVNVMSISKEVIIIAGNREDDMVCISNVNSQFSDREFQISNHLINLDWESWLHYLEYGETEKLIKAGNGDWINYVKAPILRLQYQYRNIKMKGMNAVYTGNIPIAAGLSSSSAIVVATAEAFLAVNNINIVPQKFVELCGEGEWYVGSRGGAGDHAAMIFGKKGFISKLGFLPFSFEGTCPFPNGYKLVIANSHVKANKTTNAKDAFNSKVASYEFGLMIIKDLFPVYEKSIEYLRDVNEETLGISTKKLYEILLNLPEKLKATDIYDNISIRFHKDIKRLLNTHNNPEYYYIRSVVLFGISECQRAKKCMELLEEGRITEFGQLMDASHNGDRVVSSLHGEFLEYAWDISDSKIKELIENLEPLWLQSGGYACSTKEIDFIVDISKTVNGVIGAQISGAGLGGCAMIMVRDDAVDNLMNTLKATYFIPKGLDDDISVCVPVKGSGLIEI